MIEPMKKIIIISIVSLFIISCGRSQSVDHGRDEVQLKVSSLIVNTKKTWEINHTLIITFLDGTPERKAEVELFSKEWTKYANINFEFYPSIEELPSDKNIDVLISFQKIGNNSVIGTDADHQSRKGNKSMSLSALDNENINIRRSTILHEFGHALGLMHEHQHMDRTFHLDEKKALAYCKTLYNFSEEECHINIIDTVSKKDFYLSKYDPTSIMHYSVHPGFFNNEITFRSNNSLSLLDKVEISKIYPGRMSEEEIVTDHNFLMKTVEDTTTYKNCNISEQVINKSRLNENGETQVMPTKEYFATSIVSGEYMSSYAWEDKEGVLVYLKNNEYCNFDEESMNNFRNKLRKENIQNKQFGNCTIALNEEGIPNSKYCKSEYPYSVLKVDQVTSLNNLCFGSFQAALDNLKKNNYCTQNLDKTLTPDKTVNEKLEASNSFGKCLVEYVKESTKSHCSKNYSWVVSKINGEKMNNYCFPNSLSAINFMKKEKKCQP